MKSLTEIFSTYLNRLICLLLCSLIGATQAALPTDFQNEKDLADMIAYIKSDYEVLSSVRVIDLAELTVYYGESCRIQFARKVVKREADWVGPAEPVEFKAKECMDDVVTSNDMPALEDKVAHGVIISAEESDVACYLQIKDDTGKEHDELAIFDLCQDETLFDKPKEFVYERTNILASSCEGNPECNDTESVWLITEIK